MGWLLALVLSCWAVPRIYHRLINHIPPVRQKYWEEALAGKKREVSVPWQDTRPLVILVGDSQIEGGNWYELFLGAQAVRNCGFSGATIADITQAVPSINAAHAKMAVLMCGVNSLFRQESQEACLRDYEGLLNAVRAHLQPDSILVLSLMPLRESAVDRKTRDFNQGIGEFNLKLAALCQTQKVEFLNVSPAVIGPNGALAEDLTLDGLHLNREGYRRLALAIAPHLPNPITITP